MLFAATIYNLSQQLNPEEFDKLMAMYGRDGNQATKRKPTMIEVPTVEEYMEILLAGPFSKRNRKPQKTNDTQGKSPVVTRRR